MPRRVEQRDGAPRRLKARGSDVDGDAARALLRPLIQQPSPPERRLSRRCRVFCMPVRRFLADLPGTAWAGLAGGEGIAKTR